MAFCLKMKSDYSFLSSCIKIDDAISFCKANGNKICSLIDNNLFGSYEFYQKCIKNNIKPIIGVEIKIYYKDNIYPINFIAKTEIGYKNISILNSLSNRYQTEYLDFKVLALHSQDVICILSSKDSFLTSLLKSNEFFVANSFIDDLKTIFKEIYIGIYRYKYANATLLNAFKEYANQINIPLIAFQYATHLDNKDTVVLNLLDCISKNIPANKDFLNNPEIVESYLKNDEQLKIYYDSEELNNLNKLANSVSFKINKVNFSLPQIVANPDETLKELAYAKLKEYNLERNEKYISRLNYELDIITKMGFSNYYLIVQDYVNFAKNNQIPVGPARGSGAASLVAYLLNITTIDPLKYDLLFERFLNPERSNYPDFDVDFADDKRDLVIDYLKEKYGYRHVGHIVTFNTFQTKSAIRELARIMKISNDDIDYISKALSKKPISINDEYKNNPKFKNLLDIHSNYKTLCSLASKIEGLKRQIGLHAAGMILSNDNLDELVPCFESSQNTLVIQYDYISAETLGLIKMDFLGLKNLSIIDYCINLVNKEKKLNLSVDNIDYENIEIYQTIASGEVIGLFQLESSGMKKICMKLKPNCFADIVAIEALYRPGPMDMIDTYIERKQTQKINYLDNRLKPILKPTYGIIIYQEQIMEIAKVIANYSLGEADILRRAISKKKHDLIEKEKSVFVNRAIENNTDKEKAVQLFDLIEKFASYGFNKAHSVGYSKITMIMAYLKTFYRPYFYEALLNVNDERKERRKLIFEEAKNNNIEIKGPNVNESDYYFKAFDNYIIYGLVNISSIQNNIANIIINERNKEKFNDIYDFVIRMAIQDVSLQIILDLTYAGALDCFNIERSKIIANLESLYDCAIMFKGLDYKANSYQNYPISMPYFFFNDEQTDLLKKEYEMLETYISIHPLTLLKEKQNKKYNNINRVDKDGKYLLLGKIISKEIRKSKKNNDYMMIRLEDETSQINLYEYDDVSLYQDYKKGMIVEVSISYKNNYGYIEKISEVKE